MTTSRHPGFAARTRVTAAVLAASIALSGCADMSGMQGAGGNAYLSPEQQALRQQSQTSTIATGALLTGLLGAGAGYVGARATGGRGGQGALIGGLLGAVAGGLLGNQVGNANAAQGRQEGSAQARVEAAQRSADELQQTADTAERASETNRARLATLDRQYRAGQVTVAQYRAEVGAMRQDAQLMRKSADDAGQARDGIQQALARNPGLVSTDSKISEAQSRLRFTAGELEDALRRVPAG